ncbi:hypothetical protein [Leifsonia sp. NPDC080035]|uniref:Uncharacterized protein n=1 Tax=Leifsonia sp. NPDC080035 TaxID=3143936 RepID=A0AAU7GET2_9MICO
MDATGLRPALAESWAAVKDWIGSPAHREAVRRLGRAASRGDLAGMRALMHPGVAVVVDRGDEQTPTIRVVRGPDDASVLLAHGFANGEGVSIEERSVNGQAGLMLTRTGAPLAAIAVDFTGSLVSMIWVRLNPAPLKRWNTV